MVDFKLLLEKKREKSIMAKPKAEDVWEWKPADNEEEVGGDLNIWNPAIDGKVGDELVGEIIDISEGVYGIQATIDDGISEEPWTTPAHKVLQSALAKLSVGDNVRITYTGKYKTPVGMITNVDKVARRK